MTKTTSPLIDFPKRFEVLKEYCNNKFFQQCSATSTTQVGNGYFLQLIHYRDDFQSQFAQVGHLCKLSRDEGNVLLKKM